MAYLLDKNGYPLYDVAGFRLMDADSFALITDRTAADVQKVLLYASRPMTEAELAEWKAGMKGAYNYTDFNRVEAAVEYVTERLKIAGWRVNPVTKLNWTVSDFPTVSEMERYLKNIQLLRSTLPVGLPSVPEDMNRFTYAEANVIEQILIMLDAAVTNIMKNVFYSNEIFSGEVQ